MKKIVLILMAAILVVLTGCGKMGKDGRQKMQMDYGAWYYDDESGDNNLPGVMVMSFNVRYGAADDGDNVWSNRRNACYAMVNTLRPVLMGVQECQKNQRQDLINNITGYEVIGRPRKDPVDGNDEQMAIFYQPDSVSITSWGTFWLTEGAPTTPTKHPAAGHYRCATWAKVKHLRTLKEFYYINTHLDLQGVRDFELSVIVSWINGHCGNYPVVMTADWNESDDNEMFDQIYNADPPYYNARRTAKTGDSYGTFNGFSNPNSSTRIDHVFYKGFSVCTKFITVRQKWEGVQFISDHYPVYAILKF